LPAEHGREWLGVKRDAWFGLSSSLLAAVVLVAAPPLIPSAWAQEGLRVDVATFEAGRFVMAGAAPAGMEVRIEGTAISDLADATSGRFRIARRTVLPSCTVTVAAGDQSVSVPVANCRMAMLGVEVERPTSLLRPRGGWVSTRAYRVNDVVQWDGRDWRAMLASEGRQPTLPGNDVFWEELDAGEDPTLVESAGGSPDAPVAGDPEGQDVDPAGPDDPDP
jgi:hypothetical protein